MTSTGSPASSAPIRSTTAHRYGLGFWLVAGAFLTAMAFSTVPTPLYPLYQARDGFSNFVVTIVFAAYAVGVVTSLLLAGHVSDYLGRRRVLLAALTLELVAAGIFLAWTALPALIVARVVTGLGVGMLTAAATAHLLELHAAHRPDAGRQRFEVVSTAANIGGLGFGPLVAGFLAEYVGAPLRVPYAVFVVLLLGGIVAVLLAPETVQAPAERPAYRPQRVSADHGDRAGFIGAAAGGFTAFAIFGLFTSLAPGFVSGALHHSSRLLAGAIVFAVFGGAALAQSVTTRLAPGARLGLGIAGEAVGLVTLAAGMRGGSLAGFLVGGVVAGIGAGLVFKAAVGAVAAMAAPARRGEALAGLFLISYFGLIVPVIGVGVATVYIAETTAILWFAGGLLAILAAVVVLARRQRA